MHRFLLLISLLSPLVFVPEGQSNDSLPIIGSIDGARGLSVEGKKGKDFRLPGAPLFVGDEITTGKGVTATMRYADGGVFVLGQNTGFKVHESPNAEQAAELRFGMMRGIIGKLRKTPKKKSGDKPLLRFVIRSKAAVIGVRGTDFLISAEEGVEASKVFTLEGGVEVAKTEEQIVAGEAVSVKTGEFVQATPEKIEPPQKFDRQELVQSLEQEQPTLKVIPLPEPEKKEEDKAVDTEPQKSELPTEPAIQWNHFEIGLQGDKLPPKDSASEEVKKSAQGGGPSARWTPLFYLLGTRWLFLQPRIGIFSLNSPPELLGNFIGLDVSFSMGVRLFQSLFIDAGGLVRKMGPHGTSGGESIQLSWKLNTPIWGLIEKFYMGGSNIGIPEGVQLGKEGEPSQISEFRLGVGLSF